MTKARDIIPGWPRGRSTSNPLPKSAVWPWVYVYCLISGQMVHVGEREPEFIGLSRARVEIGRVVGGGDFCFKHNVSCLIKQCAECAYEQAEERRKADMMEAFWLEQRIEARGNLYPQPPHENSCGLYPYIQELVIPREVFTYLQMFKENMEYITGGNLSGLTRSSYPIRSSEDYATVSKEQKTKFSSYSGPPRSDVPCVCCPGGKHQW